MPDVAAVPERFEPACDDPRADWVARHQGAVWRYLRYLGCARDLAEDVLQEALLAGLRQGIDGRSDGPARTWLRATARHLFVDRLRGRRRAAVVEIADLAEVVWQQQEERPRRAALHECLQLLDGRARRCVELRYGEGWSRERIAAALGIGDEGVKSLLQRTRALLRACIERRCGDDDG